MQCRDVEQVVEQEGLAPLPEVVRGHVDSCPRCQGYLADLETIVSTARSLPAESEPPARVWVAIRARLASEGVIKEPTAAPKAATASWWDGFGQFFRTRAFATVTVGALLGAAAMVQVRYPGVGPTVPGDDSLHFIEQTRRVVNDTEIDLRNMHLTSTSPVDAALEQNLGQINDFIADCERHLKAAPQDELAREYLADAYQQKAELLAAMMDRGRSVN
jgi:hypothetical protein